MTRFQPERFAWLGLVLAVVGGALALYVGPTGDAATALAVVAVSGALLYAALKLVPRTVLRPLPPAAPESSRLVLLRDSFAGGPFGRQTIIATLESLNRELGIGAPPITPPEARRAAAEMSPDEFRAWVGDHVHELERAS